MRTWLTLGLAAITVLLSGCGADDRMPLRIAAHVWPGYELMFLARSLGWLPIEETMLIETRSATDSLAALARGEVDGAALTLDEVLRARADGIALTVVMAFNISAGADVVMARQDIRGLPDLAGRRIGAETSALGTLMLKKLLDTAQLKPADVTVVSVTADDHMSAWERESLDAIITYEPTASRLEAAGARRLFDSRALPDTIFDVLAIRDDALAERGAAVRALTHAHFRALRHFRANPGDAGHRMAARLNMPSGEPHAAFRGLHLPTLDANHQLLAPEGRLDKAAAMIVELLNMPGGAGQQGLFSTAYLPQDDE